MEHLNKILCIGNNTVDSDNQCRAWASMFEVEYQGLLSCVVPEHNGCYHVGLSDSFTVDNLFESIRYFDLIIRLDQNKESYDHVETWQHITHVVEYYKHFVPVLSDPEDNFNHWLGYPESYVCKNENVVIKAGQFQSVEECARWLEFTKQYMEKNNCNWIVYRAETHEDNHFEITNYLLQFDNFVLLTPEVFDDNLEHNIKNRIYRHWYDVYLTRKASARI